MTNLKDKTVCLIGYGNSFFVAQKLSQSYGRVLYYIPSETSYPKYNQHIVGRGVEGVERIYNIWDYLAEIDLFYFEDLFQGSFQLWLRENGYLVFGAGKGEELEIQRDKFKELQKELELPLNDYAVIKGLEDLRGYLKPIENKYIKINRLRGQMETFHWDNYDLSKPILDELQHSLGAYQNEITFIVEEPIDAVCEYGYDGFVIDGNYPKKTIFGIEVKDCAYAGIFTDYKNLPQPMLEANEKLKPIFESYGYRGAWSSEMRAIDRKKAILTDMTCRNPEPPTSLAIEMYSDYGMYVWQIANGIVPDIEAKGKYGVQIVIKSEWATTEPQPIYFPESLSEFVKIKNLCVIDGVKYFINQNVEMQELGAVISYDKTLQGAIDKCKEVAKQVKGFLIKINCDALDEANAEIKKLSKVGVNIF